MNHMKMYMIKMEIDQKMHIKKLHLMLDDIFDKNGNKLDEKYNDDKSAFQVE